MSTDQPVTTTYTLPDGTQGTAEVVQPKLTTGRGSQAVFSAMAVNLIALIGAIIDAGTNWYQEPGVITLVGTLVGTAAIYFGGRSSQVNRVVDQATALIRQSSAQAELAIAAYQAELAKNDPPVVTQPPTQPTQPDPSEPTPDTPVQPDQGSAPGPGTEG